MNEAERTVVIARGEELGSVATRRRFLKTLGIGGSIVLLPSIFACDDNKVTGTNGGNSGTVTLNLNNDIGILNYAYALEQLEAAFYSQVVASSIFASAFSANEQEILTDIRNHEVIHRNFLAAGLGSAKIPDLSVSFGSALASRQSVLETARTFEDLGVSAYNGAAKYLKSVTNLLAAGKIVSVEARHAAVIRDVLDSTGRAFAGDDVVSPTTGLDVVNEPATVLAAADPFIVTTVKIGAQPTTA